VALFVYTMSALREDPLGGERYIQNKYIEGNWIEEIWRRRSKEDTRI